MSNIRIFHHPIFHIFIFVIFYAIFLSIYYFFSGRDHLWVMQLDGEYYALLVNFFKEWAPPFSANVSVPLMGGLFNFPPPMNIWINPGWLILIFLGPAWGPIIAQSFFAAVYIIGTYFFARNSDISIRTSLACAIGAFFLTHPPFQIFFLQFWMNPSVAFIVVLEMAVLGVFMRAQNLHLRTLIFYILIISGLQIYSIILDPLWSTVITFAMAPLFLPFMIAPMRILYARLIISIGAGTLIIASGLIHYTVIMQSFFARTYFKTEIHPEIQEHVCASMPWQGPLQLTFFIIFITGWILTLFLKECTESQRRLAVGCLIHGLLNGIYSSIYLFTNINWSSLPLPAYLDVPIFSIYLIASIPGWSFFSSRVKEEIILRNRIKIKNKFLYKTDYPKNSFLYLSIFMMSASSFIVYISPSFFKNIKKDIPIITELSQKISLHPGDSYRGSATVLIGINDNKPSQKYAVNELGETFLNFGEVYNIPWLWKYNIPTFDEYSQTVTPDLYFLSSRLLSRPMDYQKRNFMLPSRINVKIMEMLGIRYIITDKSDIGEGPIKRMEQTGSQGMKLFLFELPTPNLGHYSPTQELFIENAHQAIEAMGSPQFNPRLHAITDHHLPRDLTPALWAAFTLNKDGMHLKASSTEQSLLVLPLQFSNCLEVVGSNATSLFRVNLAMTGILFRNTMDVMIKNKFGYWSSACRLQDVKDMRRLKVESDGSIKLPPYLHPFALFHF